MKTLNKVKYFMATIALVFSLMTHGLTQVSNAQSAKEEVCKGVIATGQQCNVNDKGAGIKTIIQTAIRIVQTIAGVLAIFYLIYAGLKFITSSGGSDGVKSAKNMILYSSIGLVVVLISEGLIRFVLARFS